MTQLYLTERDAALVQELLNRSRRNYVKPTTYNPSPLGSAPEVYIVRTPDGGIPALSRPEEGEEGSESDPTQDVPGVAECEVYWLRYDGTTASLEKAGFKQTVFNLSDKELKDQWLVIMRDKYGHWLPVIGGGEAGGVNVGYTYSANIGGRQAGSVYLSLGASWGEVVEVYNPFSQTIPKDRVVVIARAAFNYIPPGHDTPVKWVVISEDCPQQVSDA